MWLSHFQCCILPVDKIIGGLSKVKKPGLITGILQPKNNGDVYSGLPSSNSSAGTIPRKDERTHKFDIVHVEISNLVQVSHGLHPGDDGLGVDEVILLVGHLGLVVVLLQNGKLDDELIFAFFVFHAVSTKNKDVFLKSQTVLGITSDIG